MAVGHSQAVYLSFRGRCILSGNQDMVDLLLLLLLLLLAESWRRVVSVPAAYLFPPFSVGRRQILHTSITCNITSYVLPDFVRFPWSNVTSAGTIGL
jgi:hypothetical protein